MDYRPVAFKLKAPGLPSLPYCVLRCPALFTVFTWAAELNVIYLRRTITCVSYTKSGVCELFVHCCITVINWLARLKVEAQRHLGHTEPRSAIKTLIVGAKHISFE